jgi:hypothetical protein
MKPKKTLSLSGPATYRIQIQGYLDNTWASQLGEKTFTNHLASRQPIVTVITGQVMDQTELLGFLVKLYSLGFPLVSVEYLETDE